MPPESSIPDLQRQMQSHVRLAMLALTVPLIELHLNLAAYYGERIAALSG